MEAVPPKLYGGTERIVSYLTEELVELGHDVTLFASGDADHGRRSSRAAPQRAAPRPALRCRPSGAAYRMLERVARRADEFDMIHFHIDYLHSRLRGALACRT